MIGSNAFVSSRPDFLMDKASKKNETQANFHPKRKALAGGYAVPPRGTAFGAR